MGEYKATNFLHRRQWSKKKNLIQENYLKIRSVRLFEGQYDDMEQDPVTSLIGFDADQNTVCFAELTFSIS